MYSILRPRMQLISRYCTDRDIFYINPTLQNLHDLQLILLILNIFFKSRDVYVKGVLSTLVGLLYVEFYWHSWEYFMWRESYSHLWEYLEVL